MLPTNPQPLPVIPTEQAQLFAELFRVQFPGLAARENGRLESAVRILSTGARCPDTDRPEIIHVQSESNARGWYDVDLTAKTCTCPDAGKHPKLICKHRLAAGLAARGPDWVQAVADRRDAAIHQINLRLFDALDECFTTGDRLEWLAVLETHGIPQAEETVNTARSAAHEAAAKVDRLKVEKAELAARPLAAWLANPAAN